MIYPSAEEIEEAKARSLRELLAILLADQAILFADHAAAALEGDHLDRLAADLLATITRSAAGDNRAAQGLLRVLFFGDWYRWRDAGAQ